MVQNEEKLVQKNNINYEEVSKMPVDDLLRSFNSSQKGLTNQQASESRKIR